MKKILIGLTAAGLLTAAALPAAAAPRDNINARQAQLEQRIALGERHDRLSHREAAQLRVQLREIDRIEHRYRAGGLNLRERADLEQRLDRLTSRVTAQMGDGNRYARR